MRRVTAAAGVLLLSLVVLEAALQLASLLAPRLLTRAAEPVDGALRILCVGDSHTYGAGAALAESYPRLLQENLGRRHPGLRFEVLNLGVPGINTSQVANRIERQLDAFDPDLVIVWVGINNGWNAAETGRLWDLRRLLMHSRLVRLAVVAWERRGPRDLTREPRREEGRGRREPFARNEGGAPRPDAIGSLAVDFSRIAAATRAHGLPLILINYPYDSEPGLRSAIRDAGARLGVPVVDTLEDATRAGADGVNPIFLWGAGWHPTGALYRYIAASVTRVVEQALALDPARDQAEPGPAAGGLRR